MNNPFETNETSENLKLTETLPLLESEQTKEYLETIDLELIKDWPSMSAEQRHAVLSILETKCAEITGRAPRAVVKAELGSDAFHGSEKCIEIDGKQLKIMENLDSQQVFNLKKFIFASAENDLNHVETLSFERSCAQKCVDCDVDKGMCKYG